MANKAKIMIVTADEDFIRRISSDKSANTRIIDLDDNMQSALTSNDNSSFIDLAFLAELSKPNASRDQMYKRALDLPQAIESRATKISKKTTDRVCVVCGDHAVGLHYGALTCASCKAFFHRSAFQPPEKIYCLDGQGKCSVSYTSRRKCQRCRLERCFAMGMRKDFFFSEQEKQRRKKRIDEDRQRSTESFPSADSVSPPFAPLSASTTESVSEMPDEIDLFLMNMDNDDVTVPFQEKVDVSKIDTTSSQTLSVQDWLAIQTVHSSYLLAFQNYSPSYPKDFSVGHTFALRWSQMNNQAALNLIAFFRQIDEFEALNEDDRFILIKYNLLHLFAIQKCFVNPSATGLFSGRRNRDSDSFHRRCVVDEEQKRMHNAFSSLMERLIKVTEQDFTLLCLLLVVLLFTKGLSMSDDEPRLNDPLAVHRAQSHYTRLVWNYLVDKQGEEKTIRQFTQLLDVIFKIQCVTKQSRDLIHAQLKSANTIDQITPLMQAVLNIS